MIGDYDVLDTFEAYNVDAGDFVKVSAFLDQPEVIGNVVDIIDGAPDWDYLFVIEDRISGDKVEVGVFDNTPVDIVEVPTW